MTEKKTSDLTHGMRLILWALSSKPMTTRQISGMTKQSRASVNDLVRDLAQRGLVFRSGNEPKPQGGHAPIYSVHVKHDKPEKVGLKKHGRLNRRLQIIVDAIKTHPMTAKEIAEFTGSTRANVNSCLTYTRDGGRSSKIIRVAEWVYQHGLGGGWVPAYGPGPAADAPRPDKMDRKLYLRQWHEKNKARESVRSASRTQNSVMANNPFAQLIQHAGVTRQAARAMQEAA